MKSLFVFIILASGAAQAVTQVTCDVRQWGNGREVINKKGVRLVLKAAEDDDFPVDEDWHSGILPTPVGPVTVSFDQKNLELSYDLVLGDKAGTIIGHGTHEAKMTVFLGPVKGSNNGLTVGCKLTSPAAKPPAPRMTDLEKGPYEN